MSGFTPSNKLRRIQRKEETEGTKTPLGRIRGRKKRTGGKVGGKPGAAVIVTRKKANEICASGESPLDVMLDNMLFWHHHVQGMTDQLRGLIVDATDPAQRKQAFALLEELLASRQKSQECAVDLAPYCHPKLSAIAFKKAPEGEWKDAEAAADPIAASQMYQRLIGG